MKNNYFFCNFTALDEKNHTSYIKLELALSLKCLAVQMKFNFITEMKQKVSLMKLS